MNYKITIIIPVFNAERTLKRAIDSIIDQTLDFNYIELILIDDASTDSSQEIIKKYSEKYDNIQAIFLDENSGSPSKPRNIAIEKATGQYLMFVDNDDKLQEDYCKTLYDVIAKENLDIVKCEFSYKFLDGVYTKPNPSKKIEKLENITHSGCPMWASIFNTKFIQENNIRCPNTLSEDGYFTIVAYTKTNKIAHLPNYYGYIHTVESEETQSLGHTSKIDTFDKVLEGYDITIKYLEENNYDAEVLFNEKIPRLYLAFFKFKGSKKDKITVLKKIRDYQLKYDYSTHIDSVIYRILNNFVLNEQYNQALIISGIASSLYNQRRIKNMIFRKQLNLRKKSI